MYFRPGNGGMSHGILMYHDNGTSQSPSGHSTAKYGSLGTKVGVATRIHIWSCQNEINRTACYGHEQARQLVLLVSSITGISCPSHSIVPWFLGMISISH